MKMIIRFRWGINFAVLFVLGEIDHCVAAGGKDGEKGQPEFLQPLDNHPRLADDPKLLVSSGETYQELLAQKTTNLLSEAIGMLAHAKDAGSRHWLEVFISKTGELALELEGKSNEEPKMEVASSLQPPNLPTSTTPSTQSPDQYSQYFKKHHVTSAQLSDVLAANEEMVNSQFVTLPGFSSNITQVEDEVVRQLHDQDHRMAHGMEVQQQKPDQPLFRSLPSTESTLKANGIDSINLSENERELVLQLVQEINDLQDLEETEPIADSQTDNHNVADFTNPKFLHNQKSEPRDEENEFEVVEDQQVDDSNEYSMYGEDDALAFNFYFPSTAVPPTKHDTFKSLLNSRNTAKFRHTDMIKQHQKMNKESMIKNQQSDGHKQRILPYSIAPNFQSQNYPTFKHDVQHNLSQSNAVLPYNDPDSNLKRNNFEERKELKENIFKHALSGEYHAKQDNVPKSFQLPHGKPHHSMLQEMLLEDHYRRNLPPHYVHNFKSGVPFLSGTDLHEFDRRLATQITPPLKLQHQMLSLPGSVRESPEYPNSNYNLQMAVHSKIPPKKVLQHTTKLHDGYQTLANRHKTDLSKYILPQNTDDFHDEKLSFTDKLVSNPKVQENMERQLRAGKVVVLSDSLVRMNANKKSMKESKNAANIKGGTTAEKTVEASTESGRRI